MKRRWLLYVGLLSLLVIPALIPPSTTYDPTQLVAGLVASATRDKGSRFSGPDRSKSERSARRNRGADIGSDRKRTHHPNRRRTGI